MLVDNGLEFAYNFARGAELHGIMLHTTNRMSPWESCLAERHIGMAKDVIEKEILIQQISNFSDLDKLLATVQSSRNSSPIRGGFSPAHATWIVREVVPVLVLLSGC